MGLLPQARAEGIEMAVCSPGNIERRPGDLIKTDKRDAIRLARLFRRRRSAAGVGTL
jgi:transposase